MDLSDLNGRNVLKNNINDTVNTLAVMRNFIVGIHINAIDSWGNYKSIYENDSRYEYLNSMNYTSLSKFMTGLATILQDSRIRFFIPNTVKDSGKLEILVDALYRGGCSFESEVAEDEQ